MAQQFLLLVKENLQRFKNSFKDKLKVNYIEI
jgi:hypothetical protein